MEETTLTLLKNLRTHIIALRLIVDTLIAGEASEDGEISPEERELMNKSAPGTVGGDRG